MTWCFAQPFGHQGDADRFLTALNGNADFFIPNKPIQVARAPGRLDLMGGIADYSGALVLELPLAVATWTAIQPDTEPLVTLRSLDAASLNSLSEVSISLQELYNLTDYQSAYQRLNSDPASSWIAYVLGVLVVLAHEANFQLAQGLRIFINSEVPTGKGVSSSAALEVATMQAISTLYNLQLSGREIAILCQRVENLIVGAPCGIMDQMSSSCGEEQSLLALLCQPAELQGSVALPSELEVWGIDSGIRHAVTGADYGSVRIGAFMGYRIIAELAGLTVEKIGPALVKIDDPLWSGYLANIPPSLWEGKYRDQIPERLNGAEFLDRYQGSTDTVTRIDPTKTYAVRQPTAHPIYEHHRVRLYRALLSQSRLGEEEYRLLGELMYQSHASYSACGLGSAGTDRLVELVREADLQHGLYGAKITGGGSGGTVAVLTRKDARPQIERIVSQYQRESGLDVEILSGSSPGAVAWGSQQLIPDTHN